MNTIAARPIERRERGDRDLLADRVRGHDGRRRARREDLDQQRLLHTGAAGRERDGARDLVDGEDEQHVLTEPPTRNASSRNQKATKRQIHASACSARLRAGSGGGR